MKIISFVYFMFLCNVCFSQTHKATYSYKIEVDPLNDDSSFKDEIGPLAEANELYLYFNKEASYYTSSNAENSVLDMSDTMSGTYYPMKYNYSPKSFQHNMDFDKLYVVTHNNLPLWTITNETKEISGYTCIKAIGKLKATANPNKTFDLEAWFAPELPYPTGPKHFTNLPGMVVYGVYNNFQIFKLEKIKFNDNTLNIDDIEFDGEEISEEKYVELMKELLGY